MNETKMESLSVDDLDVDTSECDSKTDDFEERLAGLSRNYREEILQQYDIPKSRATLLAVFQHATWLEKLLMILGTVMSITSGDSHL